MKWKEKKVLKKALKTSQQTFAIGKYDLWKFKNKYENRTSQIYLMQGRPFVIILWDSLWVNYIVLDERSIKDY